MVGNRALEEQLGALLKERGEDPSAEMVSLFTLDVVQNKKSYSGDFFLEERNLISNKFSCYINIGHRFIRPEVKIKFGVQVDFVYLR